MLQNKNTKSQVSKITKLLFSLGIITGLIFMVFATNSIGLNFDTNKPANAAGPNTGNLIIGTVENATTVEKSVCLQATPGPMNLANASLWLQFDFTKLTTAANAFVEKGQYGNSNNGYGLLKWQEVLGSQVGNLKTYSIRLDYSDLSGGQGLAMTTTPELYGKVSFAKIQGSTAPFVVDMVKNQFFSTTSPGTPIIQTVTNVTGDCRAVAGSSSSSSSSNISSLLSSSIANNGGGGVIIITTQASQSTSSSSIISSQKSNSISSIPSVLTIGQQSFKSNLRITDPYVCGEGAYGNIKDPKQNGIDYVYYEFYKDDSTFPTYNYKLKMNNDGDFFLPISKSTNNIVEAMYKVVFFAIDKDGNKAQGSYKAYITSDCSGSNIVKSSSKPEGTIRTGGLEILQGFILAVSIITICKLYIFSKTKEINFKI